MFLHVSESQRGPINPEVDRYLCVAPVEISGIHHRWWQTHWIQCLWPKPRGQPIVDRSQILSRDTGIQKIRGTSPDTSKCPLLSQKAADVTQPGFHVLTVQSLNPNSSLQSKSSLGRTNSLSNRNLFGLREKKNVSHLYSMNLHKLIPHLKDFMFIQEESKNLKLLVILSFQAHLEALPV